MHIMNPLQMTDWPIKKFLTFISIIQLTLWCLIGLAAIGLEIPVLRQVIGLFCLSFIPGVIILRILKLHQLGSIETLLYSVGLSLFTVMFGGAIINTVCLFAGISKPISLMPLMISFTVLIAALCIIAYARDKKFSAPTHVDIKGALSPPVLFLLLIPLLSILGTQLVNFYQNNILIMVLFAVITLTVVLIGFNRFIPRRLYPLAVFSIALSLLFYRTLFSQYISGFDIHEEYYVANTVIIAGSWDPSSLSMINSLLSITMLAPIWSSVAAIDLTWVFKIVYPFLFALAPLGMYQIFRKQSDEKIAFFACFFFIAFHGFYAGLAHIMRQQIATMFFVLLLMLMVDKNTSTPKKVFLLIVFAASLVVSHYALSYMYIGYITFTWFALLLTGNARIRRTWDWLHSKIDAGRHAQSASEDSPSDTRRGTISFVYAVLFVVVALAWYIFTSGSRILSILTVTGTRILNSFTSDLLSPETSPIVRVFTASPPPGLIYQISSVFLLNRVLIILGVLVLIWKFRQLKFQREYVAFAVFSLTMLALVVLVPSAIPDLDRLYHLMLLVLAPALVLGALAIPDLVSRFIRVFTARKLIKWAVPVFAILSVYLAVFFLYETSAIWELAEGHSRSYTLSQAWLEENTLPEEKAHIRSFFPPEQDVLSARWLSANMDATKKVYATYYGSQVQPLTSYGMLYDSLNPHNKVHPLTPYVGAIPEGDYVYLQYFNVVDGIGTTYNGGTRTYDTFDAAELAPLYFGKNKIYSNGGSEIYE